jgi:ubiquinone/menaquinone biosynthesis C-methylase UbiE
VSVLDVSSASLAVSKERLGARAAEVDWITGDVTRVRLPAATYDLWHDRAVFHFLGEAEERRAYANQATRCLKLGGHAMVATFSPEGPKRCSGLGVVRYSADTLSREFGRSFTLREEAYEIHHTPSGGLQDFIYCLFEKTGEAD